MKIEAIQEFIEKLVNRSSCLHCGNCSQILNEKGKCTGDCMADFRKEYKELTDE